MKGPAGYGRYDDDPSYVGCPYAKSDMSPCIARDGSLALAGDPPADCVGCGHQPLELIRELGGEYEPARKFRRPAMYHPPAVADQLRDMVRQATEPT